MLARDVVVRPSTERLSWEKTVLGVVRRPSLQTARPWGPYGCCGGCGRRRQVTPGSRTCASRARGGGGGGALLRVVLERHPTRRQMALLGRDLGGSVVALGANRCGHGSIMGCPRASRGCWPGSTAQAVRRVCRDRAEPGGSEAGGQSYGRTPGLEEGPEGTGTDDPERWILKVLDGL